MTYHSESAIALQMLLIVIGRHVGLRSLSSQHKPGNQERPEDGYRIEYPTAAAICLPAHLASLLIYSFQGRPAFVFLLLHQEPFPTRVLGCALHFSVTEFPKSPSPCMEGWMETEMSMVVTLRPCFFFCFLVILLVVPYLFLSILCFPCSGLQICRRPTHLSAQYLVSLSMKFSEEWRRGEVGEESVLLNVMVCCDSQ